MTDSAKPESTPGAVDAASEPARLDLADRLAGLDALRSIGSDTPGCVVGLYHGGELVASTARGLASMEHEIPLTAESMLDIASVSKQMTATAVLSAAREGVVDLDTDLRQLVDELLVPEPVTLRQCLTHTSGLPDYLHVIGLLGLTLADLPDEAAFRRVLRGLTWLDFAPGTQIRYSNTGYTLAAAVLASASQTSFAEVLGQRVLIPLGMRQSRVHDRVGLIVPRLAFSYRQADGDWVREEMPEAQVGDGAVITSLTDLAGWLGFLTDGYGLGTDLRDDMLSAVEVAGRRTRYAYGIMHGTTLGHPSILHDGGMYAYSSTLVAVPGTGWGCVVLANRHDIELDAVTEEALRLVTPAIAADQALPGPGWPARPEIAGTWLDPQTGSALSATVHDDGDALAVGGLILDRVGNRQWRGRYLSLDADRADDGVLAATDSLGDVTAYRRLTAMDRDEGVSIVRRVTGRFHDHRFDLGFVVSEREPGVAEVVLSSPDRVRRSDNEPLGPFEPHRLVDDGDAVILTCDGASVVRHREDGPVMLRLGRTTLVGDRVSPLTDEPGS